MANISDFYPAENAHEVARFSIELAGKTRDLLMPVAPMAVRQLIEAQEHARVEDGGNVRTKILFHASFIGIGWVASVAARVVRVVFRTVFAPISMAVAAYQQRNYGPKMGNQKYNIVAEDVRRIGKEWVDLFVTTIAVPLIGTVNFFAPKAIKLDRIAKFYAERIDDQRAKDGVFNAARTAYIDARAAQHRALEVARRNAAQGAGE